MTRTQRWDYLPPNWSVTTQPIREDQTVHALTLMLQADIVWRALTRPQRELMMSAHAGWPIKVRADVERRLIGRGLIDEQLALTDAGRAVVRWRVSGR